MQEPVTQMQVTKNIQNYEETNQFSHTYAYNNSYISDKH